MVDDSEDLDLLYENEACPHWREPSTCDELCLVCSHPCFDHFEGRDCNHGDCDCTEMDWEQI